MKQKIRYWLFDLDNTLYPPESGLFSAIDERINRYLSEFFDVEAGGADGLRKEYFRKYGLTLVGLMREHGADPEHYLEYVHRVPVGDYLRPDGDLRDLLDSIPVPKAVFTNGSRQHSMAVTGALGVSDAFEEIFDIASLGYVPKPDVRSYREVLDRLGLEGSETVMVEDLERNLAPARRLGMATVLVGGPGAPGGADYTVGSLEELPAVVPKLHP